MRPRPDAGVVAWIDRQPPGSLFTTSIAMADLLVGIEILPTGRKRDRLKSALTASLSHLFEDRIRVSISMRQRHTPRQWLGRARMA